MNLVRRPKEDVKLVTIHKYTPDDVTSNRLIFALNPAICTETEVAKIRFVSTDWLKVIKTSYLVSKDENEKFNSKNKIFPAENKNRIKLL